MTIRALPVLAALTLLLPVIGPHTARAADGDAPGGADDAAAAQGTGAAAGDAAARKAGVAAEAEPGKAERPARIYWLPRRPVQGDPLVVDVRPKGDAEAVEGTFLGRELVFFPWGEGRWRAVVPISLRTRGGRTHPLEVVLVGAGGERRTDERPVYVRWGRWDESKLSVDPKFTKPPKEALKRIRAEREKIRAAFAESAAERLWSTPFHRPVDGVTTSEYGTRRTFNGKTRSRHRGLDLDGRTGDPIRAMAAGRVTLADELFYTGGCVFIDHGLGLYTVYFHMSEVDVEEGARVEAGQLIGKVGATGRVTGPHLHFGVKLDGTYISPARLLDLELGSDPKGLETAARDR